MLLCDRATESLGRSVATNLYTKTLALIRGSISEIFKSETFSHSVTSTISTIVSLCQSCHVYPGIVFFPADLQFFADFEHRDFLRRTHLFKDNGEWPKRTIPTAEQYRQHQRIQILGQDARLGLYKRYTLYEFTSLLYS